MATRYAQAQMDALQAGVIPLMLEKDPILDQLRRKNRIKYRQAGDRYTQDYRVDTPGLKSYGRLATHVASEKGDYVRAIWPHGGVYSDDYVAGWDKENQGAKGQLASGTLRDIRNEMVQGMRENFVERFREELWDGDGTPLNGGTGVTILGIRQAVVDSPATGVYAGLSRVTFPLWRNRQIAGTAGPSGTFAQDVWERIFTLKTQCRRTPMQQGGTPNPDMLVVSFDNTSVLQNKHLVQNTTVSADVNGLMTIYGMRAMESENIGSDKMYILTTDTWYLKTVHPQGVLFRMHYKKDLEDHVDENDEVMVMRFKGQLCCHFPAANGVITAAS
jgi:hypothetical protein